MKKQIIFFTIVTNSFISTTSRPMERLVFVSQDSHIKIVNPWKNEQIETIEKINIIPSLACSSLSSKLIAFGLSGGHFDGYLKNTIEVRYLDEKNNLKQKELIGHYGEIHSIKTHPHKKYILISGSKDNTVRTWNIEYPPGKENTKTLEKHSDMVNIIAFNHYNPDIIASGSQDKTIILWDISKKNGEEYIKTLKGHEGMVSTLLFLKSPNNKTLLISGAWDGNIRIWDFSQETGSECIKTIRAHIGLIRALKQSPHNPYIVVSTSKDNTIKIWNFLDEHNPRLVNTIFAGKYRCMTQTGFHAVTFSKLYQNIIAASSSGGQIRLFDISKKSDSGPIKTINFSDYETKNYTNNIWAILHLTFQYINTETKRQQLFKEKLWRNKENKNYSDLKIITH